MLNRACLKSKNLAELKPIFIFVFSIFLSVNLSAQLLDKYIIEDVTEDIRANFGPINNLYQDSAGVIWMGVYSKGLAYYCGDRIIRLPLPNEAAISSHNDVFDEYDGNLYLNYNKGVYVFDPIRQVITDSIVLDNSLPKSGKIGTIAVGGNATETWIWATYVVKTNVDNYQNDYLLLFSRNGSNFKPVIPEILTTQDEATVKCIGVNALVKTELGLRQVDWSGNTIKDYAMPDIEVASLNTFSFYVDEKETIWYFGSCQPGSNNQHWLVCSLNKWLKNAKSPVNYQIRNELNSWVGRSVVSKPYIPYMVRAKTGLFLNSKYIFNFETCEIDSLISAEPERNGIKNDFSRIEVRCAIEDNSGIIWVGNNSSLIKFIPQPPAFRLIPRLSLRSFVENDKGKIYGNTNYALVTYDPVTEKTIRSERYLYWYKAWYREREIWGGALIFNPENRSVRTIHTLDSIFRYNTGMPCLFDRKDRYWVTNWGDDKVAVINPKTKELLRRINVPELKESPVELNDMYLRPSDGTVWLGTFGQGIFIFPENEGPYLHISSYTDGPVRLNNNVVSGFYEDSHGNMWIGHGAGLSCISADLLSIKHYYIDPREPESRLVYSILPEEDDRYLWVSTSKGLFRFDTGTGVFMDFPLHPWVSNSEYNRTSFFRASDGRFYFGVNALGGPTVSVFPEEAVSAYNSLKSVSSSIVLNSLSKYDRNRDQLLEFKTGLQAMDKIVLQPGERYFMLDYSVADYRIPKNNYYSYYLEGYDKDWNAPARSNNKIRYENLPPGTYTLKLRGALMLDNISGNERHIKIVVLPNWYQTWWAKTLFLLALGGGAYWYYRYRLTSQFKEQESRRLRDLDSLKTRLYTNITHEFRTPLTVIMGMNDNMQGFDKERNLIRRNARNLLRLINQLLDLSKLDSGTLKMDAVQGDVISYLHYLTESFYSMASDKKISLGYKSELKSLTMDFDEVKLQHVIYNLMSNAIKFTRPGGKVGLMSEKVLLNEKEYLQVKVKDTGIGIPEVDLPHIFDRFYQVEGQMTTGVDGKVVKQNRTFAGTGIGLALTKELIELMGGSITVKSEIDWGTEFAVLLPVIRDQKTPTLEMTLEPKAPVLESFPHFDELPTKPDQIKNDKPLVLIAEDNSGVVTFLKSLLDSDYTVLVAINGQEAVDMALEHVPDIIITDVMMPEKDGFEVTHQLKTDGRTSHIPIIMLTAKADIKSKIEGLEFGADAYLTKPFEKEELLVRLRKLMELRRTLQARYSNMQIEHSAEDHQNLEDQFLLKLREMVVEHLDDASYGIPELCKSMLMSQMQVYRKLKALTDQTPSQFIRLVRLKKGKELLLNSNLTISEVAYEVGFTDPNYFSRTFQQEFGKSPSDFRKGL